MNERKHIVDILKDAATQSGLKPDEESFEKAKAFLDAQEPTPMTRAQAEKEFNIKLVD